MLFALLLASTYSAYIVYQNDVKRQSFKTDLVQLSNIQYGIFSVDEWRNALSRIVAKKVNNFKMTETNKEKLEESISSFLLSVITKFEDDFHKEKQKTIFGAIQSGVAYLTGTMRKLKEQVPAITQEILTYLQDDKNRDEIQDFLNKKLTDYTYETFERTDYSELEVIYEKYQTKDHEQLKNELQQYIEDLNTESKLHKQILVGVFIGISLLILLFPMISWHYVLLVCIALVYLLLGIMTPMIEIDARITEMSLQFLGEQIAFTDQVLYYRSKSIVELILLLVEQSKVEVILVGVLVLLFSVVFPILKLCFTILYSLISGIRQNRVVRFFVFKTGK